MKFNLLVLAMVATFTTESQAIQQSIRSKKDAESAASVDENIDDLMDKYDGQESDAKKKKTEKKVEKPGALTAGDVQDMELKILQGNNFADTSAKAEEDDFFNGILEKYLQPGKTDKDLKKISKADALEAASDLYQEKKKIDSFAAQAEANKVFSQQWAEHDILNTNFLDQNEAYALIQDIARQI